VTVRRPVSALAHARAAVAAALWIALAPAAAAQGLVGGNAADGPLEITAQDGIEWRRKEQVYIARGDASATRGEVTVYGDRLIAHYREKADGDGANSGDSAGIAGGGDTEIYRIEAVGNVRIVDERSRTTGDKAVYSLDRQVVVVTGRDLTFETEQETITSEDSLEYWQARDLAVARGDAVARREERVIRAEVLTAHFEPQNGDASQTGASDAAGSADDGGDGANGRAQEIRLIEAFDNVRISTPEEFARGERGVYNTETEIATLVDNVRLTRGENQLNGGWGQVNLKTGVSRLRGAPPDADETQRVKALLQPDSAQDVEPSDTAEAEAAAKRGSAGAGDSGAPGSGAESEGASR
jgi:lipopolysaccharide export system protein LptA